jgi:hypothetical protein
MAYETHTLLSAEFEPCSEGVRIALGRPLVEIWQRPDGTTYTRRWHVTWQDKQDVHEPGYAREVRIW